MIRCRWLAVIFSSVLLSGCSLFYGISPYVEKPECPSGPGPTFGDRECFYKLKVNNVDGNWVSATVDRSVIEENKKLTDGIQFRDLTKRVLIIENYPFFEYNFQVEGDPGSLSSLKGSVAVFKGKPRTAKLQYLTPEQVCGKKDQWLRLFLPEHGGFIDDITEAEIKECPILAKIPNKKPG